MSSRTPALDWRLSTTSSLNSFLYPAEVKKVGSSCGEDICALSVHLGLPPTTVYQYTSTFSPVYMSHSHTSAWCHPHTSDWSHSHTIAYNLNLIWVLKVMKVSFQYQSPLTFDICHDHPSLLSSPLGPLPSDMLRVWRDKNHHWLELLDVHRETTNGVRITVMPFFIGSRQMQQYTVYWWR